MSGSQQSDAIKEGGASFLQKSRNSSQSHTLRYYLTAGTWHLALRTKQPKAKNFAIFSVIPYPRVKANSCKLHAHTFLQFDRSNSSKSGCSSTKTSLCSSLSLSLSLSLSPSRPLIVCCLHIGVVCTRCCKTFISTV